jgi:ABC-type transporter Mla MlaB component
MMRREGTKITLSGPVTLANAARVLEEGRQHLAEGARTVDFGEVTEMDSAALSSRFPGCAKRARPSAS